MILFLMDKNLIEKMKNIINESRYFIYTNVNKISDIIIGSSVSALQIFS